MIETIIEVKDLSKVYKLYENPVERLKESLSFTKKQYHKEYYALKDINFQVKKGETVGIIGTNGSGKSTLLKIITGVLNPTKGTAQVKGKVSALLELGTGFNPEYTGIENIYLNGTMMGYTKQEIDTKMIDIIDFADIGEFINQPVKSYSSGMFARLAFAVAINVEPDILIVDEALSVGDVFFQNKCFRKFDQLQEMGTTILFVSHDIHSIKQMCSKVLWIEKGKQIIFDDKIIVCSMYMNKQLEKIKENSNIIESGRGNEIEADDNHKTIMYPTLKFSGESVKDDSVEIIAFYIKDKAGNTTTELSVLSKYFVYIVAEFKKDKKDLIFGYALENNKGIPVISMNTYINFSENTFNAQKGEVVQCCFEFTLPKIMQGEYLISPAIAQGTQKNHKTLVWLHNCEKITIINEGYNVSVIEIDSNISIESYKSENVVLQDV